MFNWILLTYVVVCLVILGIRYHRDPREFWMRLAIAVSLPVIGLLMPIFRTKRWHRRNEERRSKVAELEFITVDDKASLEIQAQTFKMPEIAKEMNVVPLEEALLVNDLSTRRKMMIDLLKQDSLEYLEMLQTAVGNEDTETSHYAVSAIMEAKRKITLTLQQLSVKYEENKAEMHTLYAYADVLKNYMRSGFLDERTMNKHKRTYSEVLEQIIKISSASPEVFNHKIDTDLELHEFMSAEHTAIAFVERYPRQEDAYLALMKVYYTMKSNDQLLAALEALKRSPIRLSSKALTVVRFWSEGGNDGKEAIGNA